MQYKILIISNLYPSVKTPFYGSFVKNFVEQIRADERVGNVRCALLKGRHNSFLSKIWAYLKFYIRIFYLAIFYNYDLIYVHLITHSTLPLRIIGCFKKLEIVFNIHGEDLLVTTPLAKILLHCALPMLYKAKAIVVPSNYFKEIVKGQLPRLDSKKIIVSASGGVGKIFFIPVNCKSHKPLRIGYVSRIDRGKGWNVLLKAIQVLNRKNVDVEVEIVGDGSEKSQLLAYIGNNHLGNVRYLGPLAYNELPAFYGTLDLFVFPTQLRESLGLVGLEAMASGVPVIASRMGGIQDYLIDGINGYFFESGDFEGLASKIEYFSTLTLECKFGMSQSAQTTAREYASEKVASSLFDKLFI